MLATSMVDLATLRGLVPNLATIPTVIYFHENQFAYPAGAGNRNLLEPQMVSLYSGMAADHLLFNSHYNRDSFMQGCQAMLDRFPDKVPTTVVESLRGKSSVIPVPMEYFDHELSGSSGVWLGKDKMKTTRPIRIAWVGRFEFDKGGDGLLLALRKLEKSGLNYSLAIIGQRFRNSPAAFETIGKSFSHRLVQFGFVESTETYRQILAEADIVLSTALHEFQGLALLEAVREGCIPVVPDRLVYPEIYSSEYRYPSNPENPDLEAVGAAQLVLSVAKQIRHCEVSSPNISAFFGDEISSLYRAVFESIASSGSLPTP